MNFPKWKYHGHHAAKIVKSASEEEALGDGWVDSPAYINQVSESSTDSLESSAHPSDEKKVSKRGRRKLPEEVSQ